MYLQKKSKTGDRDFYITQQGETMYDVAQKSGIQLQYLLDYNADKKDKPLVAGTKLFLKPVTKKDAIKNMHTVAAKESVYAIAKKYNITVPQLKEWNNLQTDDLKIGQQLKISEK